MTRPTVLAISGWVLAMIAGWVVVVEHEKTPGDAGNPPPSWPTDSRLVRADGTADLVMLVHPHCPCTTASLTQLEIVQAHCPTPVHLHLLVFSPSGMNADWSNTELVAAAAKIPGVDIVRDRDGVEARRFGIEVSGHVLVYDAAGRLTFSGGITGSRGHEGDNAGCDAAIAAIGGVASPGTPAFGCSIVDPCECGAR